MKIYLRIISSCLCIGILSGCASRGTPKTSSGETLSAAEAQEVAIGQQIHNTILSSFMPYTDPKVTDYIDRVGQSLAVHAERHQLPYRFTVLYSDKIYATSAPGGFIYLTTGMLYFIENESELAAVLSHEIAQLQYQDPKNSQAHKMLDAITKGGAMVGPAFGSIGALAAVGLGVMNNMSQPHLMTPEERLSMADQKALHYMLDAGQDPQGMVDLFYHFLKAKNETLPYFYDYYQSRPITEKRFEELNKNFSKLPLLGKSYETHREIYQETTRGIREIYKQ